MSFSTRLSALVDHKLAYKQCSQTRKFGDQGFPGDTRSPAQRRRRGSHTLHAFAPGAPMTMRKPIAALAALLALGLQAAGAAELRVLSAGAVEPGLRPVL